MLKTATLSMLCMLALPTYATFQKKEEMPPTFKLQLEQETYLSDKNGLLYARSILKLVPSNSIVLYLPDGTEIKGLIKEVQVDTNDKVAVYGDVTNKQNAGFGFILSSKGVFAGAVVFRDTEITYTVQYSEPHKGFILLPQPVKERHS